MFINQLLLLLCIAVAGIVALPAEGRSNVKYASASGVGARGAVYASDPRGVHISGPGYYAGAATYSGANPVFPNFPSFQFPAFPAFPNRFGSVNTYAPQYPFNFVQSYYNALAQNAAAIAQSAKPNRFAPTKYTASSYDGSNSFFFPNFPPLPSGPGVSSSSSSSSSSSAFGSPLVNRFGEEENGSTITSSSTSQGSKPGFVGVFSSTSHGTTNVNGKEESFHVATTGVNKNGKVTTVTVHKP